MPHDRSNPREILRRTDAGQSPKEIAAALDMDVHLLYSVLRQYRPRRKRARRPFVSSKRPLVLAMWAEGIRAARIAEVLEISRARVYKMLSQ